MSKQKYTYKTIFVPLKPTFNPNQYGSTTTGSYTIGTNHEEHQAAASLEHVLEHFAKDGFQMKYIIEHNHGVIVVVEAFSDEYEHYNKELNEYMKA